MQPEAKTDGVRRQFQVVALHEYFFRMDSTYHTLPMKTQISAVFYLKKANTACLPRAAAAGPSSSSRSEPGCGGAWCRSNACRWLGSVGSGTGLGEGLGFGSISFFWIGVIAPRLRRAVDKAASCGKWGVSTCAAPRTLLGADDVCGDLQANAMNGLQNNQPRQEARTSRQEKRRVTDRQRDTEKIYLHVDEGQETDRESGS